MTLFLHEIKHVLIPGKGKRLGSYSCFIKSEIKAPLAYILISEIGFIGKEANEGISEIFLKAFIVGVINGIDQNSYGLGIYNVDIFLSSAFS